MKFGAWQATCPYHRLEKTRCTRRLNVEEGSTKEATKLLAKNWCLQAPRFSRKRDHAGWNPRAHEHFPEDIMDLQVYVLPMVPDVVKSDKQLDDEEAAAMMHGADVAAMGDIGDPVGGGG